MASQAVSIRKEPFSTADKIDNCGTDACAAPLSDKAQVAPSTTDAASKPKPCCVCKDEKSKRDECMLFSSAADPAKDCKSTIEQYRSCMAGFGFTV